MINVDESFNAIIKDLGNNNILSIIDINEINDNLKLCIDKRLVKICEGNSLADLQYVKGRLLAFLSTKKDSTTEMGAIAEFFIHLYLSESGFEPKFLYLNLEENSIKKGFDGYYSYSDEEWILESKSGSINTNGISHNGKVKESYNDLKDKLSGGSTNNPWRNAYNHAGHVDVASSSSLLQIIKTFTVEYDSKKYHKIKDFNIIPGSTIFLNGTWQSIDPEKLEAEIKTLITKFDYKKIKIICVTKKSLIIFLNYLKLTT